MLVVFLYALAWEAATPLLAKHIFTDWDHPYGDFPDWMAYFIGGAIPLMIMGPLHC